jgi:serine/threonine protein kinase
LEPIRHRVALKVLKPGMDSRAVLARFEAERQALALMDHPNIAEVLDAGATEDGRPYFAMELVKGTRLPSSATPGGCPRGTGWRCSSRSARRSSTPARRGSSTETSTHGW